MGTTRENIKGIMECFTLLASNLHSFVSEIRRPLTAGDYFALAEDGYSPEIVARAERNIQREMRNGIILDPNQRELFKFVQANIPYVKGNKENGEDALTQLALRRGDEGREQFLKFCKKYGLHDLGADVLAKMTKKEEIRKNPVFRSPEFLKFSEAVFQGAEHDLKGCPLALRDLEASRARFHGVLNSVHDHQQQHGIHGP